MPHLTTGDQDLNKLESTLTEDASTPFAIFLAIWFLKKYHLKIPTNDLHNWTSSGKKEVDLEPKRGSIMSHHFCLYFNLPWKEGIAHYFSNLNSHSENIICA